jgi:hypothetical protein
VACPAVHFPTSSPKRRDFRKPFIERVFWFSLQLFSEIFTIRRRIWRYIIVNVPKSSLKVPVALVGINESRIFSSDFQKMVIPTFTKIRTVGAELFHADGWTDGQTHHEANIRFLQITNAPNVTALVESRNPVARLSVL